MINEEQLNENIISALGIETLPDERKIAMLKKMRELVQKRILLAILKKLKDEDKEKFLEAVADDKADITEEILSSNKIDLSELVAEETVKLKSELKSQADNF